MLKKSKKFVCLLLSVMMVFTVLTPAAFAQEVAGPVPEEPVREYIYEVCPVTGFHVEINTSNAQLQEKLAADYPTVKVKGSQNGRYDVPVTWTVKDYYYNGDVDGIYTIYGNLDLTGFPNLFNTGRLGAQIKVAVGSAELQHISNVKVDISDKEVSYGTSLANVGLPTEAEVVFEGSEKPIMVGLVWSDYYPNYVGEQRLVAHLNLSSSMDCSKDWSWVATVTVHPPEGIQSITAARRDYVLPYSEKYADYSDMDALVVMEDGTQHKITVSWNYSRTDGESVLCDPVAFQVPCSRAVGTIDLSKIPGFLGVVSATAITEKIEARDRTKRELLSATRSYIPEYCKGHLKEEIIPSTYSSTETVEIDLGGYTLQAYQKVIWDTENFDLDGNIAGEYVLYGDVDLSETDIQNPSNVRAEAKIRINDIPAFLLSNPRFKNYYVDIAVDSGVSKSEIVDMLNTKYSMIQLDPSWGGAGSSLPVIWETDDFEYQGEDGVYFVKGTYDTTGREVYVAGSGTTARINVGNALKEIMSIELSAKSKTVEYNTPLEDLNLPTTAKVFLRDAPDDPIIVDVNWSDYFPTLVGTHSLLCYFSFPEYIDSSNLYKQNINITVNPPEGIKSFSGNKVQLSSRYTSQETIEKLLQYNDYLDSSSTVILTNGETYELPITWDTTPHATSGFLNSNSFYWDLGSPSYYVQGHIDFSTIPGIKACPSGTVCFEFREGRDRNNNQIISVEQPEDLHVDVGTTATEIKNLLSSRYPELRVHIDAELFPTDNICPVTWNVTDSNYNSLSEGTYTVLGAIDLTGIDAMMQYGEIKPRVNVVVGNGGVPITSVENAEPVKFTNSVSASNVKPSLEKDRPDVKVTLANGSTERIPVIWNIDKFVDYDAEDGVYTLRGLLDLSEHPEIGNPSGLYAEMKATRIGYTYITGNPEVDDIEVGFGTTVDKVRELLAKNRPNVEVPLSNGKTICVPIDWKLQTTTNYNPETPGRYRFDGDLDFSNTLYTEFSRSVWVYVTVKEPPAITSDVDLGEITVSYSTTPEQLQSQLEREYATTVVSPTYGDSITVGITWEVSTSAFKKEQPGKYTLCGSLRLLDDNASVNLGTYQAIINVVVPNPKSVASITVPPLPVRSNFLIEQSGQEPVKEHASGTTASYASLPASAEVTFDDGSVEQIGIVSWSVDSNNPALYLGTLDISERSDILPTDKVAEIAIQKISTNYEVWSVDSEAISLEVYPGTTIEQLNALLQENGLAEIDVTCCYQESAESEEPDTFAYLFCDIAIADEATNSQYNKDVPGEYDLTANLPSNFYEPGLIGETRATTTVHVTVLEPLEIVNVKPAEVDAYQSFEFENISNIPTQVTAVLEDGQEISIDATWTPENYAKDVAAQQTVLGELGDLPSMAKLPTDKEIVPALLVNVIPVNYEITQVVEEDWLTVNGGLTLAEITERYRPKKTVEISSVTEGIEAVTNYEVSLILKDETNPDYDKEIISFYDVTATLDLPDNITYVNPEGSPFDVITVIPQAVDIDAEALEATAITTVEDTPFAELALPETVLVPLTNGKTVSLPVDWGTGEGYDPSPEGLTEDNPVECEITGALTNYPDYINGADIPVTLKITVTRPLIYTVESISPARFPETGSMDINLGTGLEAICGMLESTTVQVTARSRSGAEVTVPITFSLRQEENPDYDPMTVGEYTLVGYLPLEDNFVNPNNIQVQVMVKTNKYKISNVTPVRVPGVISGTPFAEVPLPETVTVTRSDKKTDSVAATWIEGNYNPTKIGNQTVKGTLVTPLPVHLENPNNRYPMAMVTVVNPTARIIEMEQVFEEQNRPLLRARQKEEIVPGYAEYKYRVKLQHEDGTVTEEIISIYKSIE